MYFFLLFPSFCLLRCARRRRRRRETTKVTELCTGGELFDRILEKTESDEGRYSERDAMTLVTKILSAIAYCHDEHNICHRFVSGQEMLAAAAACHRWWRGCCCCIFYSTFTVG